MKLSVDSLAFIAFAFLLSCSSPSPTPTINLEENTPESFALDVEWKDFSQLIAELPNAILLDVRTASEWSEGHIEGALHLDFYSESFDAQLKDIPQDRPVLVYCAAGGRSFLTMEQLELEGHSQIYNLVDGIGGLRAAKQPVSNGPSAVFPR